METQHTGLHYGAMLTSVVIHRWGARKADKDLGQGVADSAAGKASSFSVTKRLVAAEYTKPLSDIYEAARQTWHRYAVEWGPTQRLISADLMPWFIETMDHYETLFNTAADELVANYETALLQAQVDLGDAYDPSDYPDAAQVRARYRFVWSATDVPQTGDIRVRLSDEVANRLRAQGAKVQADSTAAATKDILRRMKSVADRCMKAFADDDGNGKAPRVTESLLEDITFIATRAGAMNVMRDPTVDALVADFATAFAGVDKSVRDDYAARGEAHTRAVALSEQLDMMMG